MQTEILALHKKGYSYKKIQEQLGCSKGTISYHLGKGQKEKTKQRKLQSHPYVKKTNKFFRTDRNLNLVKNGNSGWQEKIWHKVRDFCEGNMTFTYHDVIKKFGEKPQCYLTGQIIDIKDTSSYHFDHKIPKAKGGDNSLDNLGICTRNANQAKHDQTIEEFQELCKQVLKHAGYKITK